MTASESLGLRVNLQWFNVRKYRARIKKLLKLKNGGRNNSGPPAAQPIPGGSGRTSPVRQNCHVVGNTLPNGDVRRRTELLSPPANPISTLENNDYIKNIELYIANGNGRRERRRAQLDTAASLNIMALDVLEDLGYDLEPYGGFVEPFESKPVKPLGIARGIPWNFAGGAKTFIEDFFVFDTVAYDTILGKVFLKKYGILKFNTGEASTDAE